MYIQYIYGHQHQSLYLLGVKMKTQKSDLIKLSFRLMRIIEKHERVEMKCGYKREFTSEQRLDCVAIWSTTLNRTLGKALNWLSKN